jgi:hypothetical protein
VFSNDGTVVHGGKRYLQNRLIVTRSSQYVIKEEWNVKCLNWSRPCHQSVVLISRETVIIVSDSWHIKREADKIYLAVLTELQWGYCGRNTKTMMFNNNSSHEKPQGQREIGQVNLMSILCNVFSEKINCSSLFYQFDCEILSLKITST